MNFKSLLDEKAKEYLDNLRKCDLEHLLIWRHSYIMTLSMIEMAIKEKELEK